MPNPAPPLVLVLALASLHATQPATTLAQPSDTEDGPIPTISLEETLRRAARNPPAVLRAYAAVREAEARSTQARSQWLPAFNLEASGGYAYDNQLILPGAPRLEAHAVTARAGASLEWTAFDLARGSRIAATEASAQSQRFAFAAERQRAALLAAEMYFRAGATDALVADAELSVARRTQQHTATEELVNAGTRSPVDAQRAQIEQLSAEYTLSVRRSERRAAFAALAAAIGGSPLPLVRPADDGAALSGMSANIARARSLALARRPELGEAAAAVEARRYEYDAAIGARWPTLGALASGSFSSVDVRSGVGIEGDQYGGAARVFLRWRGLDPAIWSQAGTTEAAAALAARERDELRHQIEAQVVQAYFALERATTENQRAVAVLAAAEVAREAQNGRYLAGLASLLELLDAEDLEQSARQRRIEAARDEAVARVQLMAACGELVK